MKAQFVYLQKRDRTAWLQSGSHRIPLLPDESQHLRNHSPDGFNWGYGGSGPSQLALAILLKLSGRRKHWCLQHYQQFKVDVILNLPQDSDCTIPVSLIEKWVANHEVKEGPGLKPW